MIGSVPTAIPTPPVPGPRPSEGAAASQPAASTTPAWGLSLGAPSQPPVPNAVPPPSGTPAVASYWAVNGASFPTLADAGRAMAAGQCAAPPADGSVKAQHVVWADTATQKQMHADAAKRYGKAFLATSLASMLGSVFPPLALAGGLLSTWNGWQAFSEWQASQQDAAPGYVVAEEGRIKPAAGLPLPYTYEGVDTESWGNIVPSHPFFYKPGVPLQNA